MQFEWDIIDVDSKDGVITSAQYEVTCSDDGLVVKTQGHWAFKDVEVQIPFDNVTRNDIIGWIKHESTTNGENLMVLNLERQLESLKAQSSKKLPWDSAVFKPFA